MEDFHGPHLEFPKEGHAKIEWSKPVGRSVAFRVRAHTCSLEPTTYELCVTGGLSHIRRTVRTADGDRVRESRWMRVAEAKLLWDALLEGRAR
ncbi:hypothetical protein AB0I81_08015 [Nonomuraea sp. NPDC050404]|uniref:hypothetical protein n=1 Tax=Nonomuraea sp. NPDC050404 TaxID=3155783 RepID=UPI0033D3B497